MERKRGAPPENVNAVKHGFYSRILREAEKPAIEEALSVEGLDVEIAMLRLKLCQLHECDPDNLRLILKAFTTLAKLVHVKKEFSPQQSEDIKQVVADAARAIALPIGLNLSPVKGPEKL